MKKQKHGNASYTYQNGFSANIGFGRGGRGLTLGFSDREGYNGSAGVNFGTLKAGVRYSDATGPSANFGYNLNQGTSSIGFSYNNTDRFGANYSQNFSGGYNAGLTYNQRTDFGVTGGYNISGTNQTFNNTGLGFSFNRIDGFNGSVSYLGTNAINLSRTGLMGNANYSADSAYSQGLAQGTELLRALRERAETERRQREASQEQWSNILEGAVLEAIRRQEESEYLLSLLGVTGTEGSSLPSDVLNALRDRYYNTNQTSENYIPELAQQFNVSQEDLLAALNGEKAYAQENGWGNSRNLFNQERANANNSNPIATNASGNPEITFTPTSQHSLELNVPPGTKNEACAFIVRLEMIEAMTGITQNAQEIYNTGNSSGIIGDTGSVNNSNDLARIAGASNLRFTEDATRIDSNSANTIRNLLDSGTPIDLYLTGHHVMIYGYQTNDQGQVTNFLVHDPGRNGSTHLNPNTMMPYRINDQGNPVDNLYGHGRQFRYFYRR
ncbi:MAG: hypothetical protein IT569_07190 [Leptospiraceae bacterium]|nr:hypothetical protein [Leptospiraceae bacterium]